MKVWNLHETNKTEPIKPINRKQTDVTKKKRGRRSTKRFSWDLCIISLGLVFFLPVMIQVFYHVELRRDLKSESSGHLLTEETTYQYLFLHLQHLLREMINSGSKNERSHVSLQTFMFHWWCCSGRIPGRGSFCVFKSFHEFSCSPRVCLDSLQVLLLLPSSQSMLRLTDFPWCHAMKWRLAQRVPHRLPSSHPWQQTVTKENVWFFPPFWLISRFLCTLECSYLTRDMWVTESCLEKPLRNLDLTSEDGREVEELKPPNRPKPSTLISVIYWFHKPKHDYSHCYTLTWHSTSMMLLLRSGPQQSGRLKHTDWKKGVNLH